MATPADHASGVEAFDVLTVGAGISGLDAAWHLQQRCPGLRFLNLESQAGHGGTWRTHRYPGIRLNVRFAGVERLAPRLAAPTDRLF